MLPQDWPRIVSASVVPVVIISACGLLCLAFYNRLSSLVSRLRAFHRERLAEQERFDRSRAAGEAAHGLLLEVLEEQTAHLLRRARLIRSTLTCLLSTIGCLTACSLLSGLTIVWEPAAAFAVALFVAGMVLLLLGVVLALLELRRSLDPVELETEFVSGLTEGYNGRARARAEALRRVGESVAGAAGGNGGGG